MTVPICHYQDKENTSSSVHRQVPVKRGPKVNGVRRALVPQTSAKPKVACVDENGQMKTPNQGIENSAQASSGMIGGVLPGESQKQTPQHQLGQIQQGSSQEVNKVNGQPKGSARTFVVGPSKFEQEIFMQKKKRKLIIIYLIRFFVSIGKLHIA